MPQLDPAETGNRFLQPQSFLAETHMVEPMPEAHWHDHVELNVIIKGGMTYLINGKQVDLHEGGIYCFWAAVPHQVISALDETKLVCVYVPFADFLSLVVSSEFRDELLAGHVMTCDKTDPTDVTTVTRWAQEWESDEEQLTNLLRDEARLRVRRLALNACRADKVKRAKEPDHKRDTAHIADKRTIARVQVMTSFINSDFMNPIDVSDVAKVSGLHPSSATATFRKVLGQSIAQYLRQRRLNHALKLLADTDMAIIEVAYESGHGSLTRFYDAFQRQVGCTPKDYRRRFRS
ncbi:helix-turn-helix domain-containing protein [Aestuariivirga litoralis]|uniref:helix-turn-helix domain-containing protein n=1 Tax=Aestuariivirga litoralis TaxID=2650924 RepID=UPI0018C4D387|nr:helix-turn-helix domain-containing protein [Aestuariivirga litoralis]MBG1232398.1 helix-turn-helix domain-containing protein [Aestuariivirga litoralis]